MALIACDQRFRASGNGNFYEWKIRWIRERARPECASNDPHPGDFQVIQQRLDLLGLEPESGSAQHVEILIENPIIKGHLDRGPENAIYGAPRGALWVFQ